MACGDARSTTALDPARAALERGDWEEAATLCASLAGEVESDSSLLSAVLTKHAVRRAVRGPLLRAHRVRRDVAKSGYRLLDPRIRVDELRLDVWDAHIARRWAGLADALSSAQALARMLEASCVLHVSFFPHE